MFERLFISQFKNCRLHGAEIHRVLWKIKIFVYFCGSVQPISLRTLENLKDFCRVSQNDLALLRRIGKASSSLFPRSMDYHSVNDITLGLAQSDHILSASTVMHFVKRCHYFWKNSFGQFHQHFTSTYCANIFWTKNNKAKL